MRFVGEIDGQRGTQSAPHETSQQGAATPGQRFGAAAGNVAELSPDTGRPPRSGLSILPTFVAFALLSACVDDPRPRMFSCSAIMTCDGIDYVVTPADGCADDEDDALARYQHVLDELGRETSCSILMFLPSCMDTGRHC